MGSGGHSGDASAISSWYQWSRPSTHSTGLSQRFTTTTDDTEWVSPSAESTLTLSGDAAPRRYPASAVMTHTASASLTRSVIEFGLKPPKMTECTAPIRVQANMATGSSGTIGM